VACHLNEDVTLGKSQEVALRGDRDVVDGVRFPVGDERKDAVVQGDVELSAEFHDPMGVFAGLGGVHGDEVHRTLGKVVCRCAQGEGGMVGIEGANGVGDVDDAHFRIP